MRDDPAPMPWTSLGTLMDAGVFSITTGFPCGDHNGDRRGVLQVRPYNVTTRASISLEEQKHIPAVASEGKPTLRDGDILFNNTNTKELVGKAALWHGPEGCVFSNHMTRIRVTDPTVSPRFLAQVVHGHWLIGRSQALARAHVAQASILGERFREIEVPWPAAQKQNLFGRVFDAVDSYFAAEANALAAAQDLKRAVTREIFTKGLHGEAQKETEIGPAPESWNLVQLGSLGRVGNGSTPKKTVPSYWTGGVYPWLTSAKVYDREIVSADQFVTQQALRECHLPRVQPGAVLIAITGQGKTLGHCAVLGIEATISQHVAYVALDREQAEPSFIRGYLETKYDYLRQIASGGGSTKGALTCAFLRGLPIPLPTLEEQREVVAILDAIDRKIELHKRKRSLLDELLTGLLHKLMTGQIHVADVDLSAMDK